ncbi:MAG: SDR family oxidoreductase [Mycobacteriaceae bacterium]|uniref:SDR family oxidoreductase n=1 Tax=Corynebacterium sp. TaxID=1720 RepID=UPI003F99867D
MSRDQLTVTDPVHRFDDITPPEQHQTEPGLDAEMIPSADHGEETYRGTGRLEGRKALITGGDSGIGAAVAVAFAREGADVALNYLPSEEKDARHISDVIEEDGRRCVLLPADLSDPDVAGYLVEDAVSHLGGLDALVNNAGRQIAVGSFEALTDEQRHETFETNIHAMFRVTQAALPHLSAGSTIVNTTSIQAYVPSPHLMDYATTKAAINNFTKSLSEEIAPRGIRVNAVAPGPVWTPLQPSEGQPMEVLTNFGKNTPLGRAGQPTEVAPAYVFLTSPESSYVVGSTIHVNGGQASP